MGLDHVHLPAEPPIPNGPKVLLCRRYTANQIGPRLLLNVMRSAHGRRGVMVATPFDLLPKTCGGMNMRSIKLFAAILFIGLWLSGCDQQPQQVATTEPYQN